MTPRASAWASTPPTSAAFGTVTTVAALGAVRPQPMISSRGASRCALASGMDAEEERDRPEHADELQHAVREHDLLGCTATALLDDERVPQHADDQRHDGESEPRRVTG